ncbi:MAG: ATP-dependent sacrificial sulfur transferase LarE [Acidimicrobiia bacterium]|nr:MAG: ATP-dependent sacrificial sulfur transferase LarE [Acidimicrobiia bacterium]
MAGITKADPLLTEQLDAELKSLQSVVVAFSGGVDSALLAYATLNALGSDRMLAVTADSESFASGELAHCEELARTWGMPWHAVNTDELANPDYVANDGNRCFWCKDALMDALAPLAAERGGVVTLGVNVDDLDDHRPGQTSARRRGARFPLVDAGLDKKAIRALARSWGLSVWDRPAMPCLSSRIPYGTPVTLTALSRIDRGEAALRRLGFNDIRLRHYEDTARVELPIADLDRAVARRVSIVQALETLGYRYVTLDLAGLRSGNLNDGLADDDL